MGDETASRTFLTVAGITFEVHSPDLPIAPADPGPYGGFLSSAPPTGTSGTVPVTLRRGAIPRLDSMETLFDTVESWSLHGRGAERWVASYFREKQKKLLWAARFSLGGRAVEVACTERMVRGEGGARLDNPLHYPLDQILMMYLLEGEGIVVHAAGAVFDGRGLLLAGASGAGKTTISRILGDRPGWRVLSDDRIVVRRDREGFTVHGTPWPGEGGFADTGSAPLAGVCFLERGGEDGLRELAPRERLPRLFPVVSLPLYDRDALDAPLGCCGDLIESVPALEFRFRPGSGAAAALESGLTSPTG